VLKSRWFIAVPVLAALLLPALAQDTKKKDNKGPDKKKAADKKAPEKVAADAVELKWKFEKGKAFYQTMTTTTDQNITVMNMKIPQKQTQTFYFKWEPKEQKGTKWVVDQEIIGVKMDIQIGGNPITYDSTNAAATASNPLSEFFKALVGSKFTLTIDPADEQNPVVDIQGKKEFLNKLVKANQTMEPLLNQILSDDALKQMADPAFAVVPGKPVAKGKSWTRESKLNMGPIGSYETKYTYTYDGKDEKTKFDKVKVETTLKYLPPSGDAGAGAASLPFKIKSADLKSKNATGTILFDSAKGRVASSEMKLDLDGTLSIEINGATTPVTLNQSQTTTMSTSDDNPVKKST
jgi:uncharacterized protein DUF6263